MLPHSTAFSGLAVQAVGKTGLNWAQFATLPAFHFAATRFSKTGTGFIPATRLV